MSVGLRPADGALEAGPVAKLVGRLGSYGADVRRVQLKRIGELEIDRLALDRPLVHPGLPPSAHSLSGSCSARMFNASAC